MHSLGKNYLKIPMYFFGLIINMNDGLLEY